MIKTITVGSATQVNEWHFDGGAYSVAISARVDISKTIAVSAGSATIEIQNGGTLAFNNDAAGGNCQFIADFNGLVDFTVTVGANGHHTVSAASIAGAGSFDLGKQELTVGSDNSSTEVSGSIGSDFGCSLVKVGTGTLTLSGNNGFFVGPMTIAAGTLDLDSISAPGLAGQIHFAAGTQTLRIEAAALSSNNFSATIVSFGPGDTIDLNDLPFVPGATATFNKSLFTLTVKSGATTVSFDTINSPARTHFAALGDHTGGTRVVLAIVGTAAANVIDAGHHPAAQPPPNGAPDVILGLGGNDVLSGLGGADILVGGAGKDSLSGGLAGDAFVFQKLSDSTVAHADTIADFRAASTTRSTSTTLSRPACCRAGQPGLRLHRHPNLRPLPRGPPFGVRHGALRRRCPAG